MSNILNLFLDTYLWQRDERHCFLILSPESKECKLEYLLPEQRNPNKFRLAQVEGIGHYTLSISVKNFKFFKRQTTILGLCHVLLQKLTEEGLKNLYPDLYLVYHNNKVRKQNTTEFQNYRKLVKSGKIQVPDSYIQHITQGVSLREASGWSIR